MYWIAGKLLRLILGLPGFLPGIVLHELSHAVAADRLGDPTAKDRGRITLRPEAHLDRLGAIVYVVTAVSGTLAFGWAKPVPINPLNFRNPRRDFALSSLAGPVCNLLQVGVWAVLMRLFRPGLVATGSIGAAWFLTNGSDTLGSILTSAVLINSILCCFNLIPIPPLDGSRVLAYLLPERQARLLDRLEPIGFFVVVTLIMLGGLDFMSPLITAVADLFLRLLSLTT